MKVVTSPQLDQRIPVPHPLLADRGIHLLDPLASVTSAWTTWYYGTISSQLLQRP